MRASGQTVVAFYDTERKPDDLVSFLEEVQRRVANEFGSTFRAKPIAEIHATLLRLENPVEIGDAPNPANLLAWLGELLGEGSVSVRFGGFPPDETGISSRGRRPYERAFGIDKGIVVLIGWPVEHGRPIDRLDGIRRHAQEHGFRHRYHVSEADTDPDVYMVIGWTEADPAEQEKVASAMRGWLSQRGCTVSLLSENVAVVTYTDTDLPLTTSEARSLRQ